LEQNKQMCVYLPFLCRALALEIQRDFNIDTEVRASYDFCLTETEQNTVTSSKHKTP